MIIAWLYFLLLACVTLMTRAAYNPYKSYLFFCLHAPYKRLQYSFIILHVYLVRIECLGTLCHIATWC